MIPLVSVVYAEVEDNLVLIGIWQLNPCSLSQEHACYFLSSSDEIHRDFMSLMFTVPNFQSSTNCVIWKNGIIQYSLNSFFAW